MLLLLMLTLCKNFEDFCCKIFARMPGQWQKNEEIEHLYRTLYKQNITKITLFQLGKEHHALFKNSDRQTVALMGEQQFLNQRLWNKYKSAAWVTQYKFSFRAEANINKHLFCNVYPWKAGDIWGELWLF